MKKFILMLTIFSVISGAALAGGKLGAEPMKGTKFFLYSGDKDEQWGPKMNEQVGYAKELIEKNGDVVVEWVKRQDLGHVDLT